MHTSAVIFEEPGRLVVDSVELADPTHDDLVVDVKWSGISTGTERLLWTGDMPFFPGLGYPLVPGYETVGIVEEAPKHLRHRIGEFVFVPGSAAYKDVRGLFGGAAKHIITSNDKARSLNPDLGAQGALLALSSTAYHALVHPITGKPVLPDLIVGHGILGRLLARLTVALGGAPTVWEQNPERQEGAGDYRVCASSDCEGEKYQNIMDVSGDSTIIDQLVGHLAPQGEIVLAGFYEARLDFAFPAAFMKEARIRIAAEWSPSDQAAVCQMLERDQLSLNNLITDECAVADASGAYETAFTDPNCLKMVLNWSDKA